MEAALAFAGEVAKVDAAAAMSVEDIFKEWLVARAATLSPEYGQQSVRVWDRDISTRSIAAVRLGRLSQDPGIIARFQDTLIKDWLGESP